MQISNTLQKVTDCFSAPQTAVKEKSQNFEVLFQTNKPSDMPTDSQIISYYKNMCARFPEASFKMSDIETAKNGSNPYYIGYKGHSYQQGDNFSSLNRCSIDIDVDVIRNMMTDSEYEAQVLGTIKNMIQDYPRTVQLAQSEGYQYCYAGISNEGGKLQEYMCFSHAKTSTDEETRDIWKEGSYAENNSLKQLRLNYEKLLNQTKNQMQEAFFSMFDQTQRRQNI